MAALALALAPAERLGVGIVIPDEGCDGLAQLVFAFEACAMECLAPQQTEDDFNLVQPTGRSRREVKLDPALVPRPPIFVFLVRCLVVQDDMDFFVRGLFGEHAIKKVAKVFPFLYSVIFVFT